MTCAACAARIEKRLNKVAGVAASVNFATEQATVRLSRPVSVEDLVGEVRSAGYDARETTPGETARPDGATRALRRRLAVAVGLTVPVALLAMVPPLQFPGW